MKKYPFGRLVLILMVLSISLIPMACGSDDSGPVIVTEDPIVDPTNASTTIEAISPVLADGTATSAITVSLADTKGNRFTTSGGTVVLATTGAATISTVTDNGNGTYAATVTNATAETVTISGTLSGIAITDTAEITFNPAPDLAAITIESTSPVIADGIAISTVTVTLVDLEGNAFTTSGGAVALTSTGSASISTVTDNDNGTYTATVTNTTPEVVTIAGTLDGGAITDAAEVTFDPEPVPAGPSILRINSGGPEVTIGGETFIADQYFSGPSNTYINTALTEIGGTDQDVLFYTERITPIDQPNEPFSYNIPVTNGTYTVKLYFAEIFWGIDPEGLNGGIGSRVFDVDIEGTTAFGDIDLYAELSGAAIATSKYLDVAVSDGVLNITFQSTVDRPKISAIEVFGNGTIVP